MAALVHPLTKNWLGFLKVDLLNPGIDGIALLKGTRLFTLQLHDSTYVIGKVEKGFDFPSTAANRKLELVSPTLSQFTSRQLLGELTRLGYLAGANLEFVGVTKRSKEQTSAEITVASDKTKKYLIDTPILFANQRLRVSVPSSDKHLHPNAPEALTTSIAVRGLPMYHSQTEITAVLLKLLGPKNVLNISYNQAEGDVFNRHDGVATIRCLNAAVYTHWCTKKSIPCLGKLIDFSPHARSLDGPHPISSAKSHDQRPTREVLAEALTAFKNEAPTPPSLSQIENTMQAVETRITSHLHSLGSAINTHTTEKIDYVVNQQQLQHNHLAQQLQLLTSASRDYSLQMSGIFSALTTGPPEGPLINPLPSSSAPPNE